PVSLHEGIQEDDWAHATRIRPGDVQRAWASTLPPVAVPIFTIRELLPRLVTCARELKCSLRGRRELRMATIEESAAVTVARSHVEAWSNREFDKARKSLAEDVKVLVTTTQPIMKDTNTTGAEAYMTGLKMFAQGVEPGSANVIAAIGDQHNALLLVTVRASFGPGAPKVTLPGARLYLIDDNKKITSEKVIFYAAEG